MPTVSTYLKMMDQFSRPLQSVSNGIQTALAAMERLKRVVEAPVTMSVDTSKAVETINRTKAQLESTGGTSAIQIAINSQTVAQELNNVRQQLKSGLSSAALQVGLDSQPALQEASATRERIASALGKVDVAVQLDMPAQLPMIQPQAVNVPVQLDQASAAAQWQSFRNQVLVDGFPTLTLEIDAEKAVTSIERAREKIGKGGSTAIELALNVQDIVRKVSDVKQRIVSELSQAIVHVTLDKQQALSGAANLRTEINDTVGQIDLHPKFELPARNDIATRLSSLLNGVAPTVAAKLAFEPNGAYEQIYKVTRQLQSTPIALQATLDADGVLTEIERIKQTIESTSSSAINVMLDAGSVTNGIQEIQQRLRSDMALQLTLDKQHVITEAGSLQNQISSTLGKVSLTATLDASEVMTEVERLKQRISSGAFSAIHVILDAQSVTKVFQQIQQRMRSGTEKMMLEVTFNARQAVSKAQMLKGLLEKQLADVRTKIQVELPASLTVMFTNLQRLVMRFIAATSRLQGVTGNQAAAQQKIVHQQQRILQSQNQINNKTKQTSQSASEWAGQLKGIAATYISLQGMKTVFGVTIGGAMEQQKMLDMFIARTGNIEIGRGMFEKFKADALAAGQDVNKSLQSILSFFSTTQNVDQLSQLNSLALRMAAFDSAGNGIEGAAFALKEAMSGDIVSLAERFNMSKSDIRAFKIDELGKSGDMEGFIKAFDLLLQKQRMGQEAFDRMMASPAKQAEVLGSNIKSAFNDAGISAVEGLMPLIKMLNDAFKEGKFQPFFDSLSTGLRVVANIAAWAGNLIMENLNIVQNLLIVIGIAALAMGAKFLISWIMAAWPILLIIGLIVGLISVLNHFGVSTSEIIGYIVGSFFMLAAYIWNRIAYIWNIFSALAEFLGNLFIDPIYAIQKLFYDLAMEFGGQVYNMLRAAETFASGFTQMITQAINGVLKGFNFFSEKLKDLFGIDMGQVALFDEENVHAMSDAVQDLLNKIEKPTSDKDMLDFSGTKLDTLDYTDMFNKGFSLGSGATDDLTNALGKVTDFTDWNEQADLSRGAGELDKVGKVGQLDKIKDTVDISSEDLKMMRELAEMKNIQNFVTLQPSISFGDTHVQRESDINTIVARITDKLNEDIATSVDAVYT